MVTFQLSHDVLRWLKHKWNLHVLNNHSISIIYWLHQLCCKFLVYWKMYRGLNNTWWGTVIYLKLTQSLSHLDTIKLVWFFLNLSCLRVNLNTLTNSFLQMLCDIFQCCLDWEMRNRWCKNFFGKVFTNTTNQARCK